MLTKFESTAPDAVAAVPGPAAVSPVSNLAIRTIRLGRTLTGAGARLRAEDNALHQPGHHARPSTQDDADMQTITDDIRAIALDKDAGPEARAVLAQAKAYIPVIADIRTLETTDPDMDAPATPAAAYHRIGEIHEAGIVNVTKADPVLPSQALKPGVDLVERFEHAAHIPVQDYTARMMTPSTGQAPNPAAMLRDIVEVPQPEEEEDELGQVLSVREPEPDAPAPE